VWLCVCLCVCLCVYACVPVCVCLCMRVPRGIKSVSAGECYDALQVLANLVRRTLARAGASVDEHLSAPRVQCDEGMLACLCTAAREVESAAQRILLAVQEAQPCYIAQLQLALTALNALQGVQRGYNKTVLGWRAAHGSLLGSCCDECTGSTSSSRSNSRRRATILHQGTPAAAAATAATVPCPAWTAGAGV